MKRFKSVMYIAAAVLGTVLGLVLMHADSAYAANYREIAVAVDATVTFDPKDITLREFTFDREAIVTDDVRGASSFVMYEFSKGKRTVEITGKKAGTSVAVITYLDAKGKEKKQTLYIRVTDPKVEEFETYMVRGRKYIPSYSGTATCSSIYIAAQNTDIIKTECTDNQEDCFVPVGLGAVKIAVVIDGRQYIQTVKAINPGIESDYIIIEKKGTHQLSVDGIPPSQKVVYKSSNKKVASVSKDGVITGKKNGDCHITVKVYVSDTDIIKLTCNVTVGTKKSVLAVKEAEKVLGATYSQEKRMQKGYYDCSSLVWRSYKEAGLPLDEAEYAPVAADIARELEDKWTVVAKQYVAPDDLEPGDLIFYRSDETNDRYKSIGHVAMYYGSFYPGSGAENKGRIIHANRGVELTEYSTFRTNKIVLILRSKK